MSAPHSPVEPAGSAAVPGRTLIVSNRLPVTARIDGGEVRLQQTTGGLATGLRSVHEHEGGLWIGWSGLTSRASAGARPVIASRLRDVGALSVPLSEEEVAGYYRGYSNSALWPVLHDGLRPPLVESRDWELYRAVNERYADMIAQHLRAGDRVWVHDFHLMLLPRLVRDRCPGARIGFFLHTPFPPAESFATLREASELLEGVIGANLIGFHTRDYGRNFSAAVRLMLGHPTANYETQAAHQPSVFTCPMGIDVPFFAAWARRPAVITEAARIRGDCEGPLFVGIDRLDYTKGIAERLRAFERLLELEPHLRGHARLIQVAVPSREDASGYAENRRAVEALVANLNHRYGDGEWTPVEYRYQSVDTATLVALYRAADVMLVTPVCDGMNLVAKEFIACRDDEDGVLVLSSQAGAAAELHAAVLTDPRDLDNLVRAYRMALEMSAVERRIRMRHLRLTVETNDVFQWSKRFLEALGGPAGDSAVDKPALTAGDSAGLRLLSKSDEHRPVAAWRRGRAGLTRIGDQIDATAFKPSKAAHPQGRNNL